MPMRQSTLKFSSHTAPSPTPSLHTSFEEGQRAVVGSLTDLNTIVVNTSITRTQLPTPSDSATDVSSENGQAPVTANLSKARSKRVSPGRVRKSAFREDLQNSPMLEEDKNRSVSGETLVAEDTIVAAQGEYKSTNSVWSVRDTCMDENEADLLERASSEDEVSSVITVREDSEDEVAREEKRLARKAKVEENAKKWEERKRAADQGATRRSGRSSLLSKANEIIDNIKESVLGKRPRSATEKDCDEQKPNVKKRDTGNLSKDANPKKQRLSESDAAVDEPISKVYASRREKKWLVSGLFAGQPRMFDARFTENKNKRKSKALEEVQVKENTVLPLPMFAGERLMQHGRDFKLPFDVFSPLPVGQPKPDEWKKVNKNVFVGDAAAEWRTSKFVEHSTCVCKKETRCDQDCMNRYMYYECEERNCSLGDFPCGNRAFEGLKSRTKIGGKYNVGVEVIKTVDRGYGVRSNRTFEPNQIIVEYTGEIITQEECESRMRTIYKDNECYYLMLFDQNMIIDATRGSIARFVNHSCEPNCRMEKWTVGGKPRMALFAGDRGIMTGDELTYDYNFDPYSQKNVQACKCGARNCRGILGPKPKPEPKRSSPPNEVRKKKEGKLSGAKRRVVEVLEESTNRLNKKRKLAPQTSAKSSQKKSPTKARGGGKSPKRGVLVKKASARKVSLPKTTTKLGRSDSKLKKLLVGAKSKAGSIKGRRVVSASSATEALLGTGKTAAVSRSASLKEKAKRMTTSARARAHTIAVAG